MGIQLGLQCRLGEFLDQRGQDTVLPGDLFAQLRSLQGFVEINLSFICQSSYSKRIDTEVITLPVIAQSEPAVLLDILSKPGLDERLIRHVSLVGFNFYTIEQGFRQS